MRKLFITILSVCVAMMVTFNIDAATWGGAKSTAQIANEGFDDTTDSHNVQLSAPVTMGAPVTAVTTGGDEIANEVTLEAARVLLFAMDATLTTISGLDFATETTLALMSAAQATAANQVTANALLTTMDTALAQIEIAIEGTGSGAQEMQGTFPSGGAFPFYGKAFLAAGSSPSQGDACYPINIAVSSGTITQGQNQAVGGQDGINHPAQYTYGDVNSVVGVQPKYLLYFNGTNWDRVRGSKEDGIVVDADETSITARGMLWTGSAWANVLGDTNGQITQGSFTPGQPIPTFGKFSVWGGECSSAGAGAYPIEVSATGVIAQGQAQAPSGSDGIVSPIIYQYSDTNTIGIVPTYGLYFNGTNWDRIRGSLANGMVVDARNTTAGARQVGTWNVGILSDQPLTAIADTVGSTDRTDKMLDDTTLVTPKYVPIDHAANGDNTIVAAVVGKKIRVINIMMIADEDVYGRFESGAGGAALTGQMNFGKRGGFAPGYCPVGHFETAVNTLLNLELSAAKSMDGWLVYIEVD